MFYNVFCIYNGTASATGSGGGGGGGYEDSGTFGGKGGIWGQDRGRASTAGCYGLSYIKDASIMTDLLMIDHFEFPLPESEKKAEPQKKEEPPVEVKESKATEKSEDAKTTESPDISNIQEETKDVSKSEPKPVENKNVQVVNDPQQIFEIFKRLPSYDRKLITKSYADEFDKYRIGVKAVNKCLCGNEQEINIDVTRQFFLALY